MDEKQLASLKPGDRVRLTFECEVTNNDCALCVRLDSTDDPDRLEQIFNLGELADITCEVQLRPGDRMLSPHGALVTILAVAGDEVWFEYANTKSPTRTAIQKASRMQRAPDGYFEKERPLDIRSEDWAPAT